MTAPISEPPRILIRERQFTATDRLIRLSLVVLIFALGLVAGFGVFKIYEKKENPGPFTAEWREDEILVRLRGEPVALLWDEGDHYKFALAGGKSPWHRAFVSGSIDENQLAALHWFQPSGNERISRVWMAEDRTFWERKVSADLMGNDKILDEDYRGGKSAPPKPGKSPSMSPVGPIPSGVIVEDPDFYQLTPDAIDALVHGREFEDVVSRIAGSKENTKVVMEVRAIAIKALQDIEKSHSTVVGARKGTYLEIQPAPGEGRRWLSQMEAALRKTFPDDRAAIFTRMIAAENNAHNASDYRQEVRTIAAPEHMGEKVIERKLFDEGGKLIHTSYDRAPHNRIRWGYAVSFD